jgi:hypothetical protein
MTIDRNSKLFEGLMLSSQTSKSFQKPPFVRKSSGLQAPKKIFG